jgi:hypothetical protein
LYQVDEYAPKGALMQMHLPQAHEALQTECDPTVGTLLAYFLGIGCHDCAEFYGLEVQFSQARQ